jgi:hypothetical protein
LARDPAVDTGAYSAKETGPIYGRIELSSVGLVETVYVNNDSFLAGFRFEPVFPEKPNHRTCHHQLTTLIIVGPRYEIIRVLDQVLLTGKNKGVDCCFNRVGHTEPVLRGCIIVFKQVLKLIDVLNRMTVKRP